MTRGPTWFNITSLVVGFSFLYLPIVLLVIYSFNESRLVTVWGGFSTKWYASLLQNDQLLDAAWVTLRVAFASATLATIIGTIAALVLVRSGRFRRPVSVFRHDLRAACDAGSDPRPVAAAAVRGHGLYARISGP